MKMAAALGLEVNQEPAVSGLFDRYREKLKCLHMLDLDDLECETLRLFRSCPEVSGVWGGEISMAVRGLNTRTPTKRRSTSSRPWSVPERRPSAPSATRIKPFTGSGARWWRTFIGLSPIFRAPAW